MIPKTDPELVKALAEDAKGLLSDRAFTTAVKALRQQWFGELMGDNVENAEALFLVAKLRALEAIPSMLNHFVNSEAMAQKGRK